MPNIAFFATPPNPQFIEALHKKGWTEVVYMHKPKQPKGKHLMGNDFGWLIIDLPKSKTASIETIAEKHGVQVLKRGWWLHEPGSTNALKRGSTGKD